MAITITAYSVYYYDETVTPAVGHGMAGRITDNGITTIAAIPGLEEDLNGDPQVAGFIDNSNNLRIAVTQYPITPQTVNVYDALTALPAVSPSPTWSQVENLYSLVRLGNYLYAIDYDNARVVEINAAAGTYTQTGKSYTLDSGLIPPGGFDPYGQALIVVDNVLYGLFTFADSTWDNYANSLLVRFTVDPGVSITVGADDTNGGFAPNAFALAANGDFIYVAAIGGKQGSSGTPNSATRLQKIDWTEADLEAETVVKVLDNTDFAYEYRDITFDASGNAYILMGTYGIYSGDWKLAGQLVKTADFSSFSTVNSFTGGAAGYYWTAQYTPDNQRLWFARGNEILVYGVSGSPSLVETLTMTDLKGSGSFDNLNDLSYVGALSIPVSLRGYRSPIQASRKANALAARSLARGRPELTDEEWQSLKLK